MEAGRINQVRDTDNAIGPEDDSVERPLGTSAVETEPWEAEPAQTTQEGGASPRVLTCSMIPFRSLTGMCV